MRLTETVSMQKSYHKNEVPSYLCWSMLYFVQKCQKEVLDFDSEQKTWKYTRKGLAAFVRNGHLLE